MQVHAPPVGVGQLWAVTGALVVLVDESNRVIAANPAACAALGLAERSQGIDAAGEVSGQGGFGDLQHEVLRLRRGISKCSAAGC